MEIPLGLKQAIKNGQCVLFLGAGIGFNLFDSQGHNAPVAKTLAQELADYFSIEGASDVGLSKIATIVEIRKGRKELESFIRRRLSNLEPDEALRWLFTLRWRAIYTTNYDYGIQRSYELITKPVQSPITITSTSEIVNYDLRFEVPVYHLHGSLFNESTPQIVITDTDYTRFRERRKMLFELLKQEFATSSILYIGYSNQDPNWDLVLTEMAEEFSPASLPRAFRIAPNTSTIDKEILSHKNIETIDGTLTEFCEVAKTIVGDDKLDVDRLEVMRGGIPAEFLSTFDQNPTPLIRLLSSWEYINSVNFANSPNLHKFLHGDRPNWSLIGAREFFERDIEEEIYNDILDYATNTGNKPIVKTLLASAGYGVTTLMMNLAVDLIRENAGPVFMLKPGRNVLEGDIEFACSLSQQTPFFFVDNAADYVSPLSSTINRLKDINTRALFFLGDRINEWRQSRYAIRGQEYELESLSDPEIYRLINYLERNLALNILEPLSPELRFEAIKQKHGKDLLVVMRESTEGRDFDSILQDEYWGINSPIARNAYLIVCCFYQNGTYIRDKLLAEILDISLTEFYEKTSNSTDGVIIYDVLNESLELFGARARHRIIAAIVWERCGDSSTKERILQLALDKLNLNYASDKDAFEYFVRSDYLIDNIGTLEGKIRFFDKASQKDPNSPYVRQHYARMLLRSKMHDFALQKIEEAIKLNPKLRILYHTKGHILSEMALDTPSLDIARRRLTQAEDSFKYALSLNSKDEYSYQGLASLYFGWAQRVTDSEEQTSYITRAEETISTGLRNSTIKDGLWIVSAEIQGWLYNDQSRLEALETAVRVAPNSIVARYLLARAYRKQKQPQKAIELIDPILRHDVNEFRIILEYAISMIYVNKTYSEAIAVLSLSSLYGLSDPRYIATLGGMYYLNGDFSKSDQIFNESSKQNLTGRERNTVYFRPPQPDNVNEKLRVDGVVAVVRAGYALIDVPKYQRLFCPSTKFAGLVMQRGMRISVNVCFNARGAVAENPISIGG